MYMGCNIFPPAALEVLVMVMVTFEGNTVPFVEGAKSESDSFFALLPLLFFIFWVCLERGRTVSSPQVLVCVSVFTLSICLP